MNRFRFPRTMGTLLAGWLAVAVAADTKVFFNGPAPATMVASNTTSVTLRSGPYLFTWSLDGWWYAGILIGPGTPTGRFQSLHWPDGLHAQAITAGPNGPPVGESAAKITLARVDGAVFDVKALAVKLLANTAGAGASLEIMPTRNGEDAFPDPLALDATGYGGIVFHYPAASLATLTQFDTYHLSLYVDFALVGLTVQDADPTPPVLSAAQGTDGTLRLEWPAEATGFVLESSPWLEAPAWSTWSGPITEANGIRVADLTPSEALRLFRLRHP